MPVRFPILLAGAAVLATAAPAAAQLVSDPVGDFVAGYGGPTNGDMDVIGVNASFDGSIFRFVSRSAGDIGVTPNSIFVWGINRGLGTARFGALAPGVLFDAVVILNPTGTSTVRDLLTNTATPLPVGAVTFSGPNLTALVTAALLPSPVGGVAPGRYTVNLWPRLGVAPPTGGAISDFAPDNSNIAVVTPEPQSAALLLPAAGVLLAWTRRRKAGLGAA